MRMSRNRDKITKALAQKGYVPITMIWEPIGAAPIMSGPTGGWYIDIFSESVNEYGEHEYIDTILAYNTADVLDEIERLPICEI